MSDLILNIHNNIETVYGDPTAVKDNNKTTLMCLLKNGSYYIKDFINYHRNLGFDQFLFLDNGSTDDTIHCIKSFPNTHILLCELGYKTYWHAYKEYLFQTYGKQKWSMILDVDEFFDYPFSDSLKLNDLITYLHKNKFTALVAQMIDLYPDSNILQQTTDDFLTFHSFYSIAAKKNISIPTLTSQTCEISNAAIEYYMGGWRDKIFDVGDILLTKMPLLYGADGVSLVHDHFAHKAHVADISCVIRHYKFHSSFSAYVDESVKNENHYNSSAEYKRYQKLISKNEDLVFYNSDSRPFVLFDLLKDNYIFVSENFIDFVTERVTDISDESLLILHKSSFNSLKSNHIRIKETMGDEIQSLKKAVDKYKSSISFKIGQLFVKPISTLIKLFQ